MNVHVVSEFHVRCRWSFSQRCKIWLLKVRRILIFKRNPLNAQKSCMTYKCNSKHASIKQNYFIKVKTSQILYFILVFVHIRRYFKNSRINCIIYSFAGKRCFSATHPIRVCFQTVLNRIQLSRHWCVFAKMHYFQNLINVIC